MKAKLIVCAVGLLALVPAAVRAPFIIIRPSEVERFVVPSSRPLVYYTNAAGKVFATTNSPEARTNGPLHAVRIK